jgi:hypothetical protein
MAKIKMVDDRFSIFVTVGAAIIMLTSAFPLFAPYFLPAMGSLVVCMFWDMRKDASKRARYVMAGIVLVLGLWLAGNTIVWFYGGGITPSPLEDIEDTSLMSSEAVRGTIAMLAGAVGHLLLVSGAIAGFRAANEASQISGD